MKADGAHIRGSVRLVLILGALILFVHTHFRILIDLICVRMLTMPCFKINKFCSQSSQRLFSYGYIMN